MILIKENVEKVSDDPNTIKKLKACGFVELGKPTESDLSNDKIEHEEKPAEHKKRDLRVSELREIAKKNGIDGSSISKSDLYAILTDKGLIL